MNLIPEILSWKKHYQHMVNGKTAKDNTGFYQVNQTGEGNGSPGCPQIELISPTQAVVEQAKSDLKRKISDTVGKQSKNKKRKTNKKTIQHKKIHSSSKG
jgi:hypothetical protein